MVGALEGLPGIKKVIASFPEKKAVVTYDQSKVIIEQICQTLFKVGYVASPKKSSAKSSDIITGKSSEKTNFKIDDLVCYCFEYTRKDIEQDFIKNGRSLIMEKITAEKKAGGCDCANKNPKGR